MDTTQILALLIAERDRLNNAIAALQNPARRGRPLKAAVSPASSADANLSGGKPARRRFTTAQRKRQAERMKAYWAAKRAAGEAKAASRPARKKAKAA